MARHIVRHAEHSHPPGVAKAGRGVEWGSDWGEQVEDTGEEKYTGEKGEEKPTHSWEGKGETKQGGEIKGSFPRWSRMTAKVAGWLRRETPQANPGRGEEG